MEAVNENLISSGSLFPWQNTKFLPGQNTKEKLSLDTAVYTSSLPSSITFNENTTSLSDDPMRSLAGFIRKLGQEDCDAKHCMRGYDKICDKDGLSIPFYEFRWAYFFNAAYQNPEKYWENLADFEEFRDLYDSLSNSPYTTSDSSRWFKAAEALLPLARSKSASKFVVPAEFGEKIAGLLPGWISGTDPVSYNEEQCDSAASLLKKKKRDQKIEKKMKKKLDKESKKLKKKEKKEKGKKKFKKNRPNL